MAEFVTLSCPSCGGKLEISNDTERFACAYCGQEHIVKRGGGMVSLKPITDAIGQVKTSVDRTTAELAIARLREDIRDLERKKAALLRKSPSKGIMIRIWLQFGLLLVLICGLAYLFNGFHVTPQGSVVMDGWTGFTVVIGVLAVFLVLGVTATNNTRQRNITKGVSTLDQQIAAKQAELQRHSAVVNR